MSSQISVTLPNGVVLSGNNYEALADTARRLGHDMNKNGDFYFSQSDGKIIRIMEMQPMHCRNAFLKTLASKFEEMVAETRGMTANKFVDYYMDFGNKLLANDKMLVRMLLRIREAGTF